MMHSSTSMYHECTDFISKVGLLFFFFLLIYCPLDSGNSLSLSEDSLSGGENEKSRETPSFPLELRWNGVDCERGLHLFLETHNSQTQIKNSFVRLILGKVSGNFDFIPKDADLKKNVNF